jgi:hypothetical protein
MERLAGMSSGRKRRGGDGARDPVPAVSLCLDLLAWLVLIVHTLPRDHRFTLWDRLETRLLDLLEDLQRA